MFDKKIALLVKQLFTHRIITTFERTNQYATTVIDECSYAYHNSAMGWGVDCAV